MKRPLIGFLLVAVIAALAIFGRGLNVQAHPAPPPAGTVDWVAVDAQPAVPGPGNVCPVIGGIVIPPAAGTSCGIDVPGNMGPTTVQPSVTDPTAVANVQIDVVVDETSPFAVGNYTGGTNSYQYQILFDPTVVACVVGVGSPDIGAGAAGQPGKFLSAHSSPGPPAWTSFVANSALPCPSPVAGTWPIVVTEGIAADPGEYGDGVLGSHTFQCIAPGKTALTLAGVLVVDKAPLVPGGLPYNLLNPPVPGEIICGLQADPAVVAASALTADPAPQTGTVGAPFNVTVDAQIVNNGPTTPVNADVTVTLNPPPGCTAAGGNVINLAPIALGAQQAMPQQTYSVTCIDHSYHTFTATVDIALSAGQPLVFDDNLGNNSDPSGPSAPATAVTDNTIAVNISAERTSDTLAENDNGISGQCGWATTNVPLIPPNDDCDDANDELVKNDPKTVTIEKDITLTAATTTADVSIDVTTTPTAPSNCTTTPPGAVTQTVVFTGGALGTETIQETFTIDCTSAPTESPFARQFVFTQTLAATPQGMTPPGHLSGTFTGETATLTVAVIEPFTPTIDGNIDDNDGPDSAAVLPNDGDCLVNGVAFPGGMPCEQLFVETMNADPFASVMDITFNNVGGFAVGNPDGNATGGDVVGRLLTNAEDGAGNGSFIYDDAGGSDCSTPNLNTIGGVNFVDMALPITDAAKLAAISGTVVSWAQTTVTIAATSVKIDIIVTDQGASYAQYRLVDVQATPALPAGTDLCSGELSYDMFGLTSVGDGGDQLRQCDTVASQPFDATWTRDDTGGNNYTDSINQVMACSPADISVDQLLKDEIIGDDVEYTGDPDPDIIDQGEDETRNVTVHYSGDGILELSLVGPAACNPRWTNPAGSETVINGIQTSVISSGPILGPASPFLAAYTINCSLAGTHELQMIATYIPTGADQDPLNNQRENHIQVLVLADSDGDGVDSPEDNCPNVPNPNQHDADIVEGDDGGNACDTNDDNDYIPLMVNAVPPIYMNVVVANVMFAPGTIPDESIMTIFGPIVDYCSPGLPGDDLDNLSAAELALWQEDGDGTVPFDPFSIPTMDFDGCADTDASVSVVKDDSYQVTVSQDEPKKSVEITVTNGNAAVANMEVTALALSRLDRCEVRLQPEAGDLYGEWQSDELTLVPLVLGPLVADYGDIDPDYAPTPDGFDDTLHSELDINTGPMAAGESVVLTRDYVIHCSQESDQLWWDSTIDLDYNFDSTFELAVDVLPSLPVQEEDINDNVHKNYPVVTAIDMADFKFDVDLFSLFGPQMTVGHGPYPAPYAPALGGWWPLGASATIHNNGPASPVLPKVELEFFVPEGCQAILAGLIPIPVGGPAGPGGASSGVIGLTVIDFEPVPASVAVALPLPDGALMVRCATPSFHEFEVWTKMSPDQEHIVDPDDSNNISTASLTLQAIYGAGVALVDVQHTADAYGEVSVDETFQVTKTFVQFPPESPEPFPVPAVPLYPKISEYMAPPPDCSASFHVSNAFLSKIVGGGDGLVITIDDEVVPPPYGLWEASDVVWGDPGETIDIHFKLDGLGEEPITVVEDWDKHCYEPSDHDIVLTTTIEMDGMDDPHVIYQGIPGEPLVISEEIYAEADIKIVDWIFLDPAEQTEYPDLWRLFLRPSDDVYVQEKNFLHNNGPWTPVTTQKTIWGAPSPGATLSYNVTGDEDEITINDFPIVPPPAGQNVFVSYPDVLDVHFTIDLEASVLFVEPELWNFHIAEPGAFYVEFYKVLIGEEDHIIDQDGSDDTKFMLLCSDRDNDGVADPEAAAADPLCGLPDNCPDTYNPGQEDTDGDGIGDACDTGGDHDPDVKSLIVLGPAAINLSDTTGRYMWSIGEIGNFSGHTETVQITHTLDPDSIAGCDVDEQLILPGQTVFNMAVDEQKFVVFRTRFECHEGPPTVVNVEVELKIDHVQSVGPVVVGGELPYYINPHDDHAPDHPGIGNTISVVKGIILK